MRMLIIGVNVDGMTEDEIANLENAMIVQCEGSDEGEDQDYPGITGDPVSFIVDTEDQVFDLEGVVNVGLGR